MHWHWFIQKLRRDNPLHLAAKLLFRYRRCLGNRWRRRRWSGASIATRPEDMHADLTAGAARDLWPGAYDRSWLARAGQYWPEEHSAATRRADDAAEGRFDLLGSGPTSLLDEDGRIRWHDDFKAGKVFPKDCLYLDVPICLEAPGTDIKVPWELSRFQHVFAYVWTDPSRHGPAFLRQWRDWMDANPLARGVNWSCPMDVALRAISWSVAMACWWDSWDKPTRRRMWASLADHGHFIRGNLEWQPLARTNHYFSDITGLAVLGAVLKGYPPAEKWSQFAARELSREIPQQFAEDGFDKECSTAYHRLMVELATVAARALDISGRSLPTSCRQRLAAAYQALATLAGEVGTMPLIGDNDSGRVFPAAERCDGDVHHFRAIGRALLGEAELPEGPTSPELVLLFGPGYSKPAPGPSPKSAPPERCGAYLGDSGLFVLGDTGDRMVIRCGPLTYRPVGSHQHLDQLSICLTVASRELIVDPGQFCYTPWPERRNAYRSTGSHNTVVVDGQSQCRIFAPSRMICSIIPEVRPRCLAWETGDGGGRFVGVHRGYRRLRGGGDHERTVFFDASERLWRIGDRLDLSGRHRCQWAFHLHPDARAVSGPDGWHIARDGAAVVLRWVEGPAVDSRIEPATFAPGYGREVEADVLIFEGDFLGPVKAEFSLQTRGQKE